MVSAGRLAFTIGIVIGLFGSSGTADAGCQGEIKVKNQSDLDMIRSCKSFNGNIIIDQTAMADININGIETLQGDLIIKGNDNLEKISLSLQGVNGKLNLINNKILTTLNMPQLTAAKIFELSVHPALNEVKFPAGLSQAEQLTIADTTATKVEGLKLSGIKDMTITNNIYLKQLSIGNLTKVTGALTMSANSPSLIADFSSLQSLDVGTFRNLAGISLKELKQVSHDISFISNSFSSLELPSTTQVVGTLTIGDNEKLNIFSMPSLSKLGGALSLYGNSELTSVNAFPKLEEVVGTLDIVGNFNEVDLPALADVRGGLNVQTTSNQFSCDGVNKLKKGIIKGNAFTCKASVAKPKSTVNGKGSESSGVSINFCQSGFAFAIASIFVTYLFY
ncbi:hypothetical protein BJ944DRAFT_227384 [Cunninghamella echinulata]|nr:hypothetical protein BJ944DRAFT_227384 [Cunninghamella echinulata]